MKYTLAICAIVGLVSFDEVTAIQTRNQVLLENIMQNQESDSLSEEENLQLRDINDEDHSNEFFAAGDQGMTPNGVEYIRNIPEQYGEETPNTFMRRMYDQFALE